MPQYDPYEEPLPPTSVTPLTEMKPRHDTTPQNTNPTSSTGACICPPGTKGSYHIENPNSRCYSPLELHRRHSHLQRPVSPSESVESVVSPENEAARSPKILSAAEKRELGEAERSQQEDDQIRMMMASEGRWKKAAEEREHDRLKQAAHHINDRSRTFPTHGGQVSGD